MNIKWLIFTHKLLISKPKFTSGYTLGNDDNQVKKKLNDKSSALSHICVSFKTIISFGLSLHSSFRRHVLQVFFSWQKHFHISPHSVITTASLGRLFGPTATFSIFRTTNKPSPSTLCTSKRTICNES